MRGPRGRWGPKMQQQLEGDPIVILPRLPIKPKIISSIVIPPEVTEEIGIKKQMKEEMEKSIQKIQEIVEQIQQQQINVVTEEEKANEENEMIPIEQENGPGQEEVQSETITEEKNTTTEEQIEVPIDYMQVIFEDGTVLPCLQIPEEMIVQQELKVETSNGQLDRMTERK